MSKKKTKINHPINYFSKQLQNLNTLNELKELGDKFEFDILETNLFKPLRITKKCSKNI